MSDVFGQAHAALYDDLYREKDYAAECEMITRLVSGHASQPVRSILDLGCGTGNHAIPLAQRGYEVVGVDRSEDMLARAREKADTDNLPIASQFVQSDLRDLQLERRFDAALMMFAVLGYLPTNDDVLAALRSARLHLEPGGLLIFDVWYGPGVLHERPAARTRTAPCGSGRIIRTATPTLDIEKHLCTVHFHLLHLEDNRVVSESEERHVMRYFFPRELDLLLSVAGFRLRDLRSLPDLKAHPDETAWNVVVVATAQ